MIILINFITFPFNYIETARKVVSGFLKKDEKEIILKRYGKVGVFSKVLGLIALFIKQTSFRSPNV